MTVPDIRWMDWSSQLNEVTGKVVAGIIAVTLIIYDGEVGIYASIAVMGTLAAMNKLGKKD